MIPAAAVAIVHGSSVFHTNGPLTRASAAHAGAPNKKGIITTAMQQPGSNHISSSNRRSHQLAHHYQLHKYHHHHHHHHHHPYSQFASSYYTGVNSPSINPSFSGGSIVKRWSSTKNNNKALVVKATTSDPVEQDSDKSRELAPRNSTENDDKNNNKPSKNERGLSRMAKVLLARLRFVLSFVRIIGQAIQKSTTLRRIVSSLGFFVIIWGILLGKVLSPAANIITEVPYSKFLELVDYAGSRASVRAGVDTISDVRFSPRRIDFSVGEDNFFTRPVVAVTSGLLDTMTQKGILFYAEKVNMLAASISALIPVAVLTIIWGLLLSRMVGGGQDGNVGKMVPPPAVPSGGFDMVAGIDTAKMELVEIVDFLKNPSRYLKTGARLPKGVLMVGEPGTGKTLLARAMAGEAGVPFFYCSGSEFVEMFVGRGASRLRSLFKRARASAPCVVFIDELDALGKKRDGGVFSGGAASEVEQTLNQLLVCMDGLDTSQNGVIVLGATNRPEVLDAALCRPGRFDRIVKIDKPDREGREAILKVHTKGMKLANDVDLALVAFETPGFSGAELEGVCNEAAIRSVRRKDENNLINGQDFRIALEAFIKSRSVLTKNPIKDLGSTLKNALIGGDSPGSTTR